MNKNLLNYFLKRIKKLHKKIAYLTSNSYIQSPILKCYHVLTYETLDYSLINRSLRSLNISNVDLKARGISVDLKNIQKSIHGSGKKKGLIILTKVLNKPSAIICEYTKPYR